MCIQICISPGTEADTERDIADIEDKEDILVTCVQIYMRPAVNGVNKHG